MERYENVWLKQPDDLIVWGNKTLPRQPTKFDRVGIRRLLLFIEKQIRQYWRETLSQDEDGYGHTESACDFASELLQQIQEGGGLLNYDVWGFTGGTQETIAVDIQSQTKDWIRLNIMQPNM